MLFTVSEVWNALLDLESNKGPSPNGVPPLILKSCASSFALPLCLLFNRSLASCIFPDRWKLSFVTPILASGYFVAGHFVVCLFRHGVISSCTVKYCGSHC
jgi:hypothetical protein